MKDELEKRLVNAYPKFFRDLGGDPKVTCMAWGVDCGDGWYALIEKICKVAKEEIEDGEGCENFKFEQIKEKFGTLRAYVSGGNTKIYDTCNLMEQLSEFVCEGCGTTVGVETRVNKGQSWVKTMCAGCRKESC